MKFVLAAFALGTTALAPLPAFALGINAPATREADQLVALILPEEALIRITAKVFDNSTQNEANFAPDKRALYAANPGLKDYLSTRMKAEIATTLRTDLPALRTELAALLTQEMTASEISETLSFFGSATGQKMMAHMYDGIATSSAQSEEEAKQAAMTALMASLTAEDYPALMAFGSTAAATKLQAVTPKVQEVTKAWAAKMIARNQPRFMAVADKATVEYLAKKK